MMIINIKVKKETAFIKIELFMSALNNVIVIESSNNVTIYLITFNLFENQKLNKHIIK